MRWVCTHMQVLAACCSSGLAGVYFEKVLKGAKQSLWIKNVQLSLICFFLGFIPVYRDREVLVENGFFYGYNSIVWSVVLLQAVRLRAYGIVMEYGTSLTASCRRCAVVCI